MSNPDSGTIAGPLVYRQFARVMADVGAIQKAQRVTSGPARFAFRGVDDVMNALHEPLSTHGLLCVPTVQDRVTEVRQTSGGGTMNVVHLRVRFTFYAEDGSSLYAEAWGEGQDSGDKATGKAHSMAYKSAMLQAFHVPTEDTPDADRDTTPAAPAAQRTQQRQEAPRPVHNVQRLFAALQPLSAEGKTAVREHARAQFGAYLPPAEMTDEQTALVETWARGYLQHGTLPPPS